MANEFRQVYDGKYNQGDYPTVYDRWVDEQCKYVVQYLKTIIAASSSTPLTSSTYLLVDPVANVQSAFLATGVLPAGTQIYIEYFSIGSDVLKSAKETFPSPATTLTQFVDDFYKLFNLELWDADDKVINAPATVDVRLTDSAGIINYGAIMRGADHACWMSSIIPGGEANHARVAILDVKVTNGFFLSDSLDVKITFTPFGGNHSKSIVYPSSMQAEKVFPKILDVEPGSDVIIEGINDSTSPRTLAVEVVSAYLGIDFPILA